MKLKLCFLLLFTEICAAIAQVPFVFDVENRTPSGSCNTAAGSTGSSSTALPDPFAFTNGGRVASFDDWTCRRNQIKSDIENYEIGPKPPRPSNITATYSGGTLTVRVTENGQTLTLTSNVTMPSGSGPFPVVIGMNAPSGQLSASLFNGFIQIPFNHDQVVTYAGGSGSINSNDPYFRLYPSTNIGKYSAWAWGISRLIDGLEIVKAQMNCNLEKIVVTGCSYAGKMALFGGAFDERVALTIAQESGGGGINSWRTSQAFTSRTGTNIEKIDNTNYSWFKSSMRNLNPNTLPHDHHELIAMIAPRAFLALGNPGFEWLGDESGYKSCMAALEVWKAMGVADRFGFDFTGGHNHCSAASQQNTSVTTFLNRFIRNTTTTSNVRINPSQSGFDLSMTSVINWTTPTITFNDNGPKVTITSPVNGAAYVANEDVQITATVTDKDNNVTKVEFFVNTRKIGEKTSVPYSAIWSTDVSGNYTIEAKATDAQGNTGAASVTVSVKAPQAPYGGVPHSIPGKIEFELYDTGGPDSAYYDSSPGSETDVAFRIDEDVDLEECTDAGGGYNIGWATKGEWTEYTIDVKTEGIYEIDFRVACNGTGRTMSLTLDGALLVPTISIPNTAGWQTWQTITSDEVNLTKGKHVLRSTIGATDYINLNFMEFKLLIATSLQDNNEPNIVLYPNPFNQAIHVSGINKQEYKVLNLQGVEMERGKTDEEIGVNLQKGTYLLVIKQADGSTITKSIIKL